MTRMTADRRLHARVYHLDVVLHEPDETVFFDV